MMKFYAQSWALTHYLFFGDKGAHEPQLRAFMQGLQTGDPPDVVFKRVFGEDLGPLDGALRQYVNLMQLPAIRLKLPLVDLPNDASPLTQADAEQIQADLLERQGAFDESNEHLERALLLNPDSVSAQLTKARSLVAQDKADDALAVLASPGWPATTNSPPCSCGRLRTASLSTTRQRRRRTVGPWHFDPTPRTRTTASASRSWR